MSCEPYLENEPRLWAQARQYAGPQQGQLALRLKKEVKNVDRQIGDLGGSLTGAMLRCPLLHRIDAREDECQKSDLRLSDLEIAAHLSTLTGTGG